jgi:hypothetical protein
VGHVINLSLHAFLLANSKEALQAVINAAETSTSENIEAALMSQVEKNSTLSANPPSVAAIAPAASANPSHTTAAPAKRSKKGKSAKDQDATNTPTDGGWSGIAPLRKPHNIAVLLRTSVILYQSWKSAIGVVLGIDNATRWNSWFNMLDVAIRRRPSIAVWLMEHVEDIGDNDLDQSDWELLQITHEFLQAFKQGTLLTERRLSDLSNAMTVLDALLIHCRKCRVGKTNTSQ